MPFSRKTEQTDSQGIPDIVDNPLNLVQCQSHTKPCHDLAAKLDFRDLKLE